MGSAIRKRGKVSPPRNRGENIAPILRPLTEDIAIERLSAAIFAFPVGDIATAAKSTKEAAKGWKLGKAMPRSVALINMAREIPEVRAWLVAELESGQAETMDDPAVLDALARRLLKHLGRE